MTKTKTKGLLALALTLVLAVAAMGTFSWGTAAKAYTEPNSDVAANYGNAEFDFWAGNSKVEGNMSIENAGWPITDKLVLTLKAGSGTPGAIVRYKARYYWGNKPGAEVLMEEHTLGSSVSSWDLWCDHGGIPNNTGTSNKRWNCNFVVFWLQAKGGNGQVVDYRLIFNFNDGEKDTFITDCQKDTALLEEWRKDFRSWSPAW